MNEKERFNGFQLPLHWKQVAIWIVCLAITISTYAIKFPKLFKFYKAKLTISSQEVPTEVDNRALVIIIFLSLHLAVYIVNMIFIIYYTWYCTDSCPTDPAVLTQRKLKAAN